MHFPQIIRVIVIVWATLLAASCGDAKHPIAFPMQDDNRPNILLIMVDDMGYTDLGAFGGEIDTPHLDALAFEGVRLTNFHVASTCSPTRAMLMSGTDNHVAGLGSMAERRAPNQIGQPGYEGFLNSRVVSLAERMQDAGYRTYMTGKWHLGLKEDQSPAARGFDRSFALLPGGSGHFDDTGVMEAGHPAPFRENQNLVELPPDFGFSSDFYTRRLIEYLRQDGGDQRPFFAFLSFTAPHWPLQAPSDFIAKYSGRYDEGYIALRDARLERAESLGVIPAGISVPDFAPTPPEWDALPEQERKIAARKMEVYAAMVDNIDVNVGRLIQYLDSIERLDNTIVIFLSDNGPEASNVGEEWPPIADWVTARFDNRLEHIGSAESYVWYGRWGQVSSSPGRLYKGFQTQGGIQVPAFITYQGFPRQGTIAGNFVSVMDIMPTLLEVAEIDHPGTHYRGREVEPMQGTSMLPWLSGEVETVHPPDHVMGWEMFGRRGLRQGYWKIIWNDEPYGTGNWELYDLENDPGETENLASGEPERLARLEALWEEYVRANGVIIPSTEMPSEEAELR